MKIKLVILFLSLLLVCVFAACTGTIQTVEVTRLVPQTVEVTKIVPQTVIVTQPVQRTATIIPKTPIPVDIRTKPDQSTAYYDGTIVLAKYYTLLDQKLYGQAYQLLSSSRPNAKSLEEFVNGHEKVEIYTFELISVQPYYEWAKEQGSKSSPDSETKKRFYIRVYAEGEGGMAGSVTNGVHTFFATLVWENGEWKIYSINTSPQ
jgi:hypothetical protein